ncbi:sterol desaturase family protein [Coleofasciculus sp. LEGE 07081]|uniref:sterol desaturase family protein n=1 Tax=unclassified Coleofasciculus TaxID=2692782 RepID=UPI00187F1E87|nr:sterol desaturase family protein [Coleofasciculus sp. LEGE 07081]MBE9149981.1 sterol desaturase family protein [Coleofasciculus sp. LEGE 07092]
MTDCSFWLYWLIFFGIILGRYFLIAGGTHLLFYSVLENSFPKRWLRLKPPLRRAIQRDINLSMLSGVVFAFCAALIISGYNLGVTLLYTDLREYGLWYLGVSFMVVLVVQDAYFYVIHRVFHHPLFFKWLHQGHHRSGDPTPWTSFAFDPPEAFVQALFFVGVVLIVPLHFITLIAALMTMTLWAVLTHLGFELFPSSFPRHWLGRWFIGSTHHSIHHRKYTVHYGLYFTIWDKLFGTHDPNYEKEFDSSLRR